MFTPVSLRNTRRNPHRYDGMQRALLKWYAGCIAMYSFKQYYLLDCVTTISAHCKCFDFLHYNSKFSSDFISWHDYFLIEFTVFFNLRLILFLEVHNR